MPTPPPITFSAADTADGQALSELRVEAMRESLERIGRFDPVRVRERFLSGFSPEHTRHIEFKGERIGFVVVKPHGEGLLLDHLYVHPRHQSKGIGAAVLEQVFAEADAAGLPVRVGALRGSESNLFYARHGFVEVERSEFDNYYVRPIKNALQPVPRASATMETASASSSSPMPPASPSGVLLGPRNAAPLRCSLCLPKLALDPSVERTSDTP